VRKIRDFRLRLSHKEVRRRARSVADLESIGLGLAEERFRRDDPALEKLVDAFCRRLKPAVLFESFGPDSPETAALSPLPGLAHTLALTTLGSGAGEAVAEASTENKTRGKLYELMARMAGEEAVQFVTGLLKDEVEEERCDLSPIHYLTERQDLNLAFEKLGGSKIGLSLDAGGLHPVFSSAFCLSWISRGRSKKAKPGAKTPPQAGRKP
jgi:hypothetical protein